MRLVDDLQILTVLQHSVVAALALRLYYLFQALHNGDYVFDRAASGTAGEAQLFYSLIAATIPCMRPFLKAFNSGFLGVAAGQADQTQCCFGSSPKGSHRPESRTSRTAGRPRFRPDQAGKSETVVEHDPMYRAETGSRTSDGSEKMIIRQTVAWNVQYGEEMEPDKDVERSVSDTG